MRSILKNNKKRGQGGEVIGFLMLGILVVFLLYIIAVPMAHVWDETSIELKNESAFGSDNKTVRQIEKFDGFVTPLMDQIVFIAFIGIVIVLFVVATFTEIHPIFLAFLGIGVIVMVIISSQLVDVADQAVNNAELDGKSDEFVFSSTIMGTAFPLIILVVGAFTIVILLSKSRGGGA